jgi:capsular exopolysaccharide synthesis family protein
LLNLSITTTEQLKGVDFLNSLVKVYNRDAIEEKNKEAMASKIFIDERIALIDKELGSAEKRVENFKKELGLTDLETDTRFSVQKNNVYEEKLLQIETQIYLVTYLDNYLKDPKNAESLVPINMGVNDQILESFIAEYNKCLLDRDRYLRSNNESNPLIKKLNLQIKDLRNSIDNTLSNVKQRLDISRNDTRKQLKLYGGKINSAPTLEREYSGILRDQQIKASLFLMLLQKREEAALKLALSVNSAKVVEDAVSGGAITANSQQIYLFALVIGLLIPVTITILIELLQFKVRNSNEVKKISKLPVLGEIPVSAKGNISVHENENKNSDEAFRIMRTNLLFTLGKDKNVILVTSSGTSEGKTYIAINSAISMSLLPKKKVILVGLDLRIPMLVKYLGIESTRGISEYLSEIEPDLNKLILPSGILPNLFVLPSGPIPPNPTELLTKETLEKAIDILKNDFDYIFIDSAPTSTVSDTIVCARVADATVYVCRANVTFKSSLKLITEFTDRKKLINTSLVVNAVKEYKSGYGFKFGYGYGYCQNPFGHTGHHLCREARYRDW